MSDQTRFILNESDLPRSWYNINADSPVPPAPVLHPGTMEPVTPDFLSVLFPMDLILQEISTERYIDIPEEVREIYKLYRPTPLLRARRLEKALDTPAHIYYKNESVSPAGSHKPTRQLLKLSIIRKPVQRHSPPKQAQGNGAQPSRWPAVSLSWTLKCIWSGFRTTRNLTAAFSWKPTARRYMPAPLIAQIMAA